MSLQNKVANLSNSKSKEIMYVRAGSFLYTHAFKRVRSHEHFIGENIFAYQLSGISEVTSEEGELTMKRGQMIFARRNQLAKYTKIPVGSQNAHCVCVILTVERLQLYALEHGIVCEEKYEGNKLLLMEPNDLLKGYFSSINSYARIWSDDTIKLASMKVNEVIEILLITYPELKSFLFDFTDPQKQDLRAFMLKNFRYNVSLEQFAMLSGRSLTSFKREFAAIFGAPPALWLKNKRLTEAFTLLKKNLKPDDIYHELGFQNLSHFYTSFKQKYRVTPSEISKMNSNLQLEKMN